MRKTRADIRAASTQPVVGVALVLLSVVSFIMALWVLMSIVRTVVG